MEILLLLIQRRGEVVSKDELMQALWAKEKKPILQEQKQIEELGLPEGPTQYLIASFYANQLDGVGVDWRLVRFLEANYTGCLIDKSPRY